ncbi:MAG: hypothetical protein AVO35_03685 [Candidatus Aegiribacteria sp. MLS_C]|nr:MAG: hypothetical protein AVO35_03685 [Candidatus Aegiribacteria sp. MLS_C]
MRRNPAAAAAAAILSLATACGDSTGPVPEHHYWEDLSWNLVDEWFAGILEISYAVSGDSIYFMAVQPRELPGRWTEDMPDVVSLDVIYNDHPESHVLDASRMITYTGQLETDDWYEYWYPYGKGDVPLQQSIPLQPDDSLGGTNNVDAVFWGIHEGDSTMVCRKPLNTRDTWDLRLVTDSTFFCTLTLIWGQPGDSVYFYEDEWPVFELEL